MPYDAQSQLYPSRHSAALNRMTTDVAVGGMISPPAEYVRPQCCQSCCRLDDSTPDVNRSWRQQRFVTTADALMSHTGKTVERSAGRTVLLR